MLVLRALPHITVELHSIMDVPDPTELGIIRPFPKGRGFAWSFGRWLLRFGSSGQARLGRRRGRGGWKYSLMTFMIETALLWVSVWLSIRAGLAANLDQRKQLQLRDSRHEVFLPQS